MFDLKVGDQFGFWKEAPLVLERKRFVAADLAFETPKIYSITYESYESILLISRYQTYHLRVSYNYESIDWLHNSPVPIEVSSLGCLMLFVLIQCIWK